MTTLYVGNLSYAATDADLRSLFGPFGTIVSARVAIDRETQRPRGFGFVEMSTAAEAQAAIVDLDTKSFAGRTLVVNLARPKPSPAYSRHA